MTSADAASQPTPGQPKSLSGKVVMFAAYSPHAHPHFTYKNVTEVKNEILRCGGFYSASKYRVTHMIATPTQYQKSIGHVNSELLKSLVQIVTYDWLAASLTSTSPISTTGYLLHDPVRNGVDLRSDNKDDTVGETNGGQTKRLREDEDGDDADDIDNASKPKKAKHSEATATCRISDTVGGKPMPTNVPVDRWVTDRATTKVCIDDGGIPYDATLSQTNSGRNNNKFYRIQVLDTMEGYKCWTRWGRVGDVGHYKLLGGGDMLEAITLFKRKFREKNGNTWESRDGPVPQGRYTFVEMNYEDSDDKMAGKTQGSPIENKVREQRLVKSKLPGSVQRLVQLIFNVQIFNDHMSQLNYDADKMPLGNLSKKALLKGYEVLKELAAFIADPKSATAAGMTFDAAIEGKSNQYLSLVPHVLSRKFVPVLRNIDDIKREIELLETLTEMQLANEIMRAARAKQQADIHLLDKQYEGLGMREMTPLDQFSAEYREITKYLTQSVAKTHSIRYSAPEIFRIEREGETDRVENSAFRNLGAFSDRRLLWHGSRCTNFGGILSQGLRIAPSEAPVSGYMFGKGIYLADMSTKSANYCVSSLSNGMALLLLCEAELGNPHLELTRADHDAERSARTRQAISTWGVGKTGPTEWKDASCISEHLKGVKMPANWTEYDRVAYGGPYNRPLDYNEYIVYNVAQVQLRYLLMVKIN